MKQMNSTLVVDGPMRDDHLGLKGWVKSRKAFVRASPLVLGPRIPDFLSRLVTLSNFMRLSLRESRIRVVASAASRKSGQRWGTRTELSGPQQLEGRPVVSHISRKTSEMWGTRPLFGDGAQKARYCFSPRSFNIGFTLGSVPSHALYMAARSSVFPRERTMRRKRSPFARVKPPWSRNH